MGIRSVSVQGTDASMDSAHGAKKSSASEQESDLFAAMLGSLQGQFNGVGVQPSGAARVSASKPAPPATGGVSMAVAMEKETGATKGNSSIHEGVIRAATGAGNTVKAGSALRTNLPTGHKATDASETGTANASMREANAVPKKALAANAVPKKALAANVATSQREPIDWRTGITATSDGDSLRQVQVSAQAHAKSGREAQTSNRGTKVEAEISGAVDGVTTSLTRALSQSTESLPEKAVVTRDVLAGMTISPDKAQSLVAHPMIQASAHKSHSTHDVTGVLAATSNIGQVSAGLPTTFAMNQAVDTQSPTSSGAGAIIDARAPEAVSTLGTMVASQAEQGNAVLHVQVQPHGLGELQIIVAQSANGMDVQVVASQQAAFAWLQGQWNGLQQSMQAAGLAVNSLSLSMASDGQQGRDDRSRGDSRMRSGGVQLVPAISGKQMVSSATTDLDVRLLNLYA
ncbi:hypothetical protein Alches_06030 [Alicyclobacillus hesperidum subsp. aegles]|uniref:flagellar hook-length control protein FliK n=1 Tax=Alicyclobacillus hesperidum TaxID=89784 RepID=UPI00222C1164|nr:flagellar hook-length control protein FliK [Alicyclobacillus hesperidum]GLG00564.1 hypothetical protein Alches_06030 [Alicyclobacillus hesperidum subsp. aegles]